MKERLSPVPVRRPAPSARRCVKSWTCLARPWLDLTTFSFTQLPHLIPLKMPSTSLLTLAFVAAAGLQMVLGTTAKQITVVNSYVLSSSPPASLQTAGC